MRVRLAAVISLCLICFFALPFSVVHARTVTLSQEADTEEEGAVSDEDESQGGEAGNEGEGEGQSDADAETGAGADEQEAATEEEGPPWTYQMARIGIALMLIVGLLMGLLYWRMIASRQRAA
jgi:cobalamin biosynthesis Mg chelatase CobN